MTAVSHLLTDCLSHENCPCLFPWLPRPHCYPAWWYRTWFHVPLPLYKDPYPFAPHTVAPGPLTTSMRSKSSSKMSCASQKTPENRGV